jgi:hypothetical protein
MYRAADGSVLELGGKTGTGDNRHKSYGPGRRLMESRAVDRTATFVFHLGDRFYGTVTAYVAGPAANRSHFTSALAVQVLAALAPQLQPLVNGGGAAIANAKEPPAAPPAVERKTAIVKDRSRAADNFQIRKVKTVVAGFGG